MKKVTPYLYILPCFLTVTVFLLIPVLYNIAVSFTDFKGIDLSNMTWNGIGNYKTLFADPNFRTAIKNTVIFMALTIVFQVGISLVMTIFLERGLIGSRLFEVIFFVPSVLSSVIIAYTFNQIYEPNFGFLNSFLGAVDLKSLQHIWLSDMRLALYCILAANVYQWTGMGIIYYRAGLANISHDVYESATIDGAGYWQRFRYITFPLLKPAHLTMVLMGTIGTLKFFDLVYIMTQGGPAGATEFPMTYLYKRFSLEANNGLASALAVVILVIAFVISALQVKLFNRDE